MTDFESIWRGLDQQVDDGRVPGYAAAVRIHGEVAVRVGGRRAIEPDAPATTDDTLFRIASLTKPIGGALTMLLVDDGLLGLDDEVSRWVPELAEPRVLRTPDGPLDDTVPAEHPITVRHLLTCTAGFGAVFESTPLQQAMVQSGVYPGPLTPQLSADAFVSRVASLPLVGQPGSRFLYDTPIDVLGVLLARATGRTLGQLVAERVTGPLGLRDTAFQAVDPSRLATAYLPTADGLQVLDPADGMFSRPPAFEELGSGLVSTAGDLLRCLTALADGELLGAASLAAMTSDQLPAGLAATAGPILGDGESWGFGCAVDVTAAHPHSSPGRWGWNGGTGTTAYVDPLRDTVCVLLTQRAMGGPDDGFEGFWTAVARAAEPDGGGVG